MNIENLKEDLDRLDKVEINGMMNLCYGDGYYANSLVNKYGKSIIELKDILKEKTMSMSDQMVNGDGLERLKKFDENIKREETIKEASYKYNIGFEEMVNFYQKASPSELTQMQKIIKKDNWIAFKKLIKNVLGISLKG